MYLYLTDCKNKAQKDYSGPEFRVFLKAHSAFAEDVKEGNNPSAPLFITCSTYSKRHYVH